MSSDVLSLLPVRENKGSTEDCSAARPMIRSAPSARGPAAAAIAAAPPNSINCQTVRNEIIIGFLLWLRRDEDALGNQRLQRGGRNQRQHHVRRVRGVGIQPIPGNAFVRRETLRLTAVRVHIETRKVR